MTADETREPAQMFIRVVHPDGATPPSERREGGTGTLYHKGEPEDRTRSEPCQTVSTRAGFH